MIIFINGSINSGKTTVSKLLAEKLAKPAFVEIDNLGEFIEWMPIDEAVPINLENAVSVIKNLARRGFNIVAPYPISQEDYNYMMKNLEEFKDDINVFTLSPKLEKALTNRGNRELHEWEKGRIEHHYSIGIHNPSFGVIIDNTELSSQETVELILKEIRDER
jgi:guanylate kinase